MAWLRSAYALVFVPSLLLGACDPDGERLGDPEELGAPGAPEGPAEEKPEPAELCDETMGAETCTTADGEEGVTFCIVVDGEEQDTPCMVDPGECSPGESYDQGCLGEICYWEDGAFRRYSWSEPDCETPLVVSFDSGPIELMPAVADAFDLSTDGTCTSTDWPSAPWLALDRDGDGTIRDGSELFGSATAMASGGHAEHGFAALAELDSDRDGKITAADARFGELVLWSDLDDDRIGTSLELRSLRETGLVAIDLAFDRKASCDDYGNCGFERAWFEYQTSVGVALGEVVDVHLACR